MHLSHVYVDLVASGYQKRKDMGGPLLGQEEGASDTVHPATSFLQRFRGGYGIDLPHDLQHITIFPV